MIATAAARPRTCSAVFRLSVLLVLLSIRTDPRRSRYFISADATKESRVEVRCQQRRNAPNAQPPWRCSGARARTRALAGVCPRLRPRSPSAPLSPKVRVMSSSIDDVEDRWFCVLEAGQNGRIARYENSRRSLACSGGTVEPRRSTGVQRASPK